MADFDFNQLLTSGINTAGTLGVAALGGSPKTNGATAGPQPANGVNGASANAQSKWILYGVVGFGALMILVLFFAFRKKGG